jgi:CBS domain-containing protein
MNDLKVVEIMTHLVVTFRPGDSVEEAARRMVDNRISGGPVVESGRLVGVVSEADLVGAYAPPSPARMRVAAAHPLTFLLRRVSPRSVDDTTVADVMTSDVVTLDPEASVWEAACLIDRHGVRRLPVVDSEGYVVGIVARADVVRAMARPDETGLKEGAA